MPLQLNFLFLAVNLQRNQISHHIGTIIDFTSPQWLNQLKLFRRFLALLRNPILWHIVLFCKVWSKFQDGKVLCPKSENNSIILKIFKELNLYMDFVASNTFVETEWKICFFSKWGFSLWFLRNVQKIWMKIKYMKYLII